MATQQQAPRAMGLPPLFTSLTMSVLRPMALMAMTMRNLESILSGAVMVAGSAKTVVTTLARIKRPTKVGKARRRLKVFAPSPPALRSARICQMASTSVMGMMASVRVSLTMVAASSVLAPGCMPSQAAAAAVTEDVSLTAVPANRPKPSLVRPSMPPSVGKMSAAITLNRKMTEMA